MQSASVHPSFPGYLTVISANKRFLGMRHFFFFDLLLIFLFFRHVIVFLVSRHQYNIRYEYYAHTATMVGTVFNGKHRMILVQNAGEVTRDTTPFSNKWYPFHLPSSKHYITESDRKV